MHYFIQVILHLHEYLTIFISQYGAWVYAGLFLVIFCETGLVFAAFLPGDSLLFAVGAIAASGGLNVYILLVSLIIAAFIGNLLNYWIGNRAGYLLFKNKNSRIFKKSYLDQTHLFYKKHGARTLIIGYFIPIIRTFAAFVAGIGKMNYRKFILFNFIGVCLWMFLLIGMSYWFGNIPFIKQHFSFIIIAIIVVSLLPPMVECVRVQCKKPSGKRIEE